MKKFLIKATAGLFVLSLFMAPVAVFAAEGSDTCRTRSDIEAPDVEQLTGASVRIEGGTLLPTNAPGSGNNKEAIQANFAIVCVFSLVQWISNIVFLIIGILSVMVIAVSAIFFFTAAGNEDRLKKAKDYLLYGAIGIAVAAAANLIPAIIRGFLGS